MARILVVDDEEIIRDMLHTVLRRLGHEVLLADRGKGGIEVFRRERPQITILDLNMPGKGGWAASENITRRNPYVPMIIMTGLPDQFPIASAAGAGALLEKPLNPEELLCTIEDLLGEPRMNHWLRRRSWLQDARSVPSTKFVSNGRNSEMLNVPTPLSWPRECATLA